MDKFTNLDHLKMSEEEFYAMICEFAKQGLGVILISSELPEVIGLSEGEIFRKHILKNAIIPIVHGIPASVLGAMTGAIITERVYVVPGVGNVLTKAINAYDNGVIVGVTLFYALLSVTSIILGDVMMSMMDPRISFTSKAR